LASGRRRRASHRRRAAGCLVSFFRKAAASTVKDFRIDWRRRLVEAERCWTRRNCLRGGVTRKKVTSPIRLRAKAQKGRVYCGYRQNALIFLAVRVKSCPLVSLALSREGPTAWRSSWFGQVNLSTEVSRKPYAPPPRRPTKWTAASRSVGTIEITAIALGLELTNGTPNAPSASENWR